MMQRVGIDKIAVGGKAGIVPVFDVVAGDLVAPAIGAFAIAASLDIAATGQELVPYPVVVGHPHADIGMGGLYGRFLRRGAGSESRRDSRREDNHPAAHQCGALVGRMTISLTSTSSGCSRA